MNATGSSSSPHTACICVCLGLRGPSIAKASRNCVGVASRDSCSVVKPNHLIYLIYRDKIDFRHREREEKTLDRQTQARQNKKPSEGSLFFSLQRAPRAGRRASDRAGEQRKIYTLTAPPRVQSTPYLGKPRSSPKAGTGRVTVGVLGRVVRTWTRIPRDSVQRDVPLRQRVREAEGRSRRIR